jgi:hypothetical protein
MTPLSRIAIVAMLGALPLSVLSKDLSCSARGLTLSVPEDWTVNDTRCLFSGPGNVYLAEIDPSRETAGRNINFVSDVATALLKAGLRYEEYGQRIEVRLSNSRGLQRTFKDSAGRNVVQLVVERDRQFWQLLLQTPMEVWSERKEQLLEVLHSVKVGTEGEK